MNCDAPVKNAMAAGTVRDVFVDVSEIAKTKSFQAKMKTRIAVVNTPGRGEREDDLAEGLERRRPVDLGRLLELPRDLAEERRRAM